MFLGGKWKERANAAVADADAATATSTLTSKLLSANLQTEGTAPDPRNLGVALVAAVIPACLSYLI